MTREEAIQFLDNMKHEEAGRAIGKDGFYAELMGYHVEALNMAIKVLEQEPKIGNWIADEVQLPDRVVLNYHCSVCGRKLVGYSTKTLKDAPYCHCGAKMESEET